MPSEKRLLSLAPLIFSPSWAAALSASNSCHIACRLDNQHMALGIPGCSCTVDVLGAEGPNPLWFHRVPWFIWGEGHFLPPSNKVLQEKYCDCLKCSHPKQPLQSSCFIFLMWAFTWNTALDIRWSDSSASQTLPKIQKRCQGMKTVAGNVFLNKVIIFLYRRNIRISNSML